MILSRIRAGRKIRFVQDYYGGQYIELPWVSLLGWPKRRIKLTPDDFAKVREAVSDRRRVGIQRAA